MISGIKKGSASWWDIFKVLDCLGPEYLTKHIPCAVRSAAYKFNKVIIIFISMLAEFSGKLTTSGGDLCCQLCSLEYSFCNVEGPTVRSLLPLQSFFLFTFKMNFQALFILIISSFLWFLFAMLTVFNALIVNIFIMNCWESSRIKGISSSLN